MCWMEFLTNRTKKSRFVENVITRGDAWPLGRRVARCSLRLQTFAHPSLQYCGHCTSLKNNVSVVKTTLRHIPHIIHFWQIAIRQKKNWAICQKFHFRHIASWQTARIPLWKTFYKTWCFIESTVSCYLNKEVSVLNQKKIIFLIKTVI